MMTLIAVKHHRVSAKAVYWFLVVVVEAAACTNTPIVKEALP